MWHVDSEATLTEVIAEGFNFPVQFVRPSCPDAH